MWALVLNVIMQFAPLGSSNWDNENKGLEIGISYKELAPELVDKLNHSKHRDIDNSDWSHQYAPNTDNCFSYSQSCQPDFMHHVFYLPMEDHKGYYSVITFSYNWNIIAITDTYKHS